MMEKAFRTHQLTAKVSISQSPSICLYQIFLDLLETLPFLLVSIFHIFHCEFNDER